MGSTQGGWLVSPLYVLRDCLVEAKVMSMQQLTSRLGKPAEVIEPMLLFWESKGCVCRQSCLRGCQSGGCGDCPIAAKQTWWAWCGEVDER